MRFILAMFLVTTFGAAFQTCSKSGTATKPDVVKTNTNTAGVTNTNTAIPAPPTSVPEDAPRISLEDAKKDFDKENAVFIDTRAEAAYKVEHIKGSINIPLDAVEARYKELSKDKKVIAYCS